MTGESLPPGDSTLINNALVLKTLTSGFNRLPQMFEGMHRKFDVDFPFSLPPFRIGTGRRFMQKILRESADKIPHPIKLDPIIEVKQQGSSDCVGAVFASAFSEITGIPVTPELYGEFLRTALGINSEPKLAEQDGNMMQLSPFALNVFSTREFKQTFPSSEVTVAAREKLSLAEISDIISLTRSKENPSYRLFVFLPFESWTRFEGRHLVTLQEIGAIETTIYDPKLGRQRILPNADFNKKWQVTNKKAIFVFAKTS